MLDDIDREAAREGFALTALMSYSGVRKANGKSDPHSGYGKLPKPEVVDIVRILQTPRYHDRSD